MDVAGKKKHANTGAGPSWTLLLNPDKYGKSSQKGHQTSNQGPTKWASFINQICVAWKDARVIYVNWPIKIWPIKIWPIPADDSAGFNKCGGWNWSSLTYCALKYSSFRGPAYWKQTLSGEQNKTALWHLHYLLDLVSMTLTKKTGLLKKQTNRKKENRTEKQK